MTITKAVANSKATFMRKVRAILIAGLALLLFMIGLNTSAQTSPARSRLGAETALRAPVDPGDVDPTVNGASYITQNVPQAMTAGQVYSVSVTMRNTGGTTWEGASQYRLGDIGTSGTDIWGLGRVDASHVDPGDQQTFSFQITAPSAPGSYVFQWRMLREGVEWFGSPSASRTIVVSAPARKNDAQQLGISVPTTMTQGNVYSAAVTMKNTGNTTWTPGTYKLGSRNPTDNQTWGSGRVALSGSVAPGQQTTFNFPVTAPAPGAYSMQWGMVEEGVEWFGAPVAADINVAAPPPVPTISVNRSPSPMTAGQPYTLNWSSTGATALSRTCSAAGSGFTVTDSPVVSGGSSGVASAQWVNYPSTCVWTASGPGGAVSTTETMTTNPEPRVAPTATLTAPSGGSEYLAVNGSYAVRVAGNAFPGGSASIARLEVLEGTAVLATASAASIDTTVALATGSHALQLRAIDNLGQTGLSAVATVVVKTRVTTYDGALQRTNYVVYTGDVNGDGQLDILLKAVPKIVMIPIDDDLSVPIPIPSPSPSFVLLSSAGGAISLVSNPDAATLGFSWTAAPGYTLTFGAPDGASAGTVSVAPAGAPASAIVVSMSSDTGQLQLQSAPVVSNPGAPTGSASSDVPVPIAISDADIPQLSNPVGGTLPGSLSAVNGATTYSIPISVPPGTAGMVPQLGVSYNSDQTTGAVGTGWSLSGMSSISRCARTIANDGISDAIRFTDTVWSYTEPGTNTTEPVDRLCLDGQRLILVNGAKDSNFAYWADTAEYRTEIESFSRIRTKMIGGKRTFTVETKSGQILTYGDTADSYVEAVGRADGLAHKWHLSTVADRSGNYMSYRYSEDAVTGESKPLSIRWGGNSKNGQPHYARASFVWESRSDFRVAYIAGSHVDEELRLKKIVTTTDTAADGSGGVAALEYTFTYDYSASSARSLLKSIQACDGAAVCLPATTFTWGALDPNATKGFIPLGGVRTGPNLMALAGTTTASSNHPLVKRPLDSVVIADFTGDGKADILERFRVSENGNQQRLWESNSDGTAWTVSTPFANISGPLAVVETGDFDGDGLMDVLVADYYSTFGTGFDNWRICYGKSRTADGYNCDAAVNFPAHSTEVNLETPRLVKDFNADGRDDIFLASGEQGYGQTIYRYMCLSNGSGFDCLNTAGTSEEYLYDGSEDPNPSIGGQTADVDGDGHIDNIALMRCRRQPIPNSNPPKMEWKCGGGYGSSAAFRITNEAERGAHKTYSDWFSFGTEHMTVLLPPARSTLTGDVNADGYSDIVFGVAKVAADNTTLSGHTGHICVSKGNGEADCRQLMSSLLPFGEPDLTHLVLNVGDYDGDGVIDVIRPGVDTANIDNFYKYQLCQVGNARQRSCEAWSGPQFYSLARNAALINPETEDYFNRPRSMFAGDFDGDGKIDIASYLLGNQWQISRPAPQATIGQALDKMIAVTNGVGFVEKAEYASAGDASIYQATALAEDGSKIDISYPIKLMPNTRQLVKTISRSNGHGGWLSSDYKYFALTGNANGRGAAGFLRQEILDRQSGISSISWTRPDFPFIGVTAASRTVASNGVVLNDSKTVWDSQKFVQSNGANSVFPFIANKSSRDLDLGGRDLGTRTVANVYGDGWGNLTSTVSAASLLVDPSPRSVTTASNYFNDANAWRLGELLDSVETRVVPGSSIARTKKYTYDGIGLLKTEVHEPADLRLKITATTDRSGNVFGLENSVNLEWIEPLTGAAASRISERLVFDAKGRFATSSTNAIGHVTGKTYDPRNGMQASITSPNQLTVSTTTDGFGSITSETSAIGTISRTYFRSCTASCPPDATTVTIRDQALNGVRIAVPVLEYFDNGGRLLRTESRGFDGRKIFADRRYDVRGRLWEVDLPRFDGASPILSTRTEYDDLNRVTSTTSPDELGTMHAATTDYLGMTTRFTNEKLQVKTETRDAWGQLRATTDALSNTTAFERDAFNNLKKTTDPAGNVVRIEYDVLGRRIALRDPDLGFIEYVVNPIGQVVKQVKPSQRATGQATLFAFDVLGRMTSRDERDLRSSWTYDSAADSSQAGCSARKSCGQLVEDKTLTASGATDYRRTFSFDSLGRSSTTTVFLDKEYSTKLDYDLWGRVIRHRSSRSGAAEKIFDRRYNQFGYLARVERASTILWRADARDASGALLNATLGNGIVVGRSYDPASGMLRQADARNSQGTLVLQEGYSYDILGNVELRSQYWPGGLGFTESFEYDNLNRLKSATVSGGPVQNYRYNAVGNMLSKTGIGTGDYVYPEAGDGSERPHAVSSIPGIGSFIYDVDGNLTEGAGRSLTWTSFSMPVAITKGAVRSTFIYGPDYQRVRQERSDGTSIVYAGSMEVETRNGVSKVKTYWPMGIGVEVDQANETQLNWMHSDRLGSVVVLSDAAGNLREPLAYDSWGKRRIVGNIASMTDNKGFTGHEMLDQLDLVHMNGRVYDPTIARFVSADTYIQDPQNSQSYNRYSYVLNNPTNVTDPTGFQAESNSVVVTGSRICRPCEDIAWEAFKRAQENSRIIGARVAPVVAATAMRAFVVLGAVITPTNLFQKNTEDEEMAAMHAAADAQWDAQKKKDAKSLASSSDEGASTATPPPDDEDSDEGSKPKTGKSDRHGDKNAMSKAEKQIEKLREELKGTKGRTERQKIEQKIKNINATAQRNAKGETHWMK